MLSTSRSRHGALRGNIAVHVTFHPLICLGIEADHYPLAKLRRSYSTELSIEQQLSSDACLSRTMLVLGNCFYRATAQDPPKHDDDACPNKVRTCRCVFYPLTIVPQFV